MKAGGRESMTLSMSVRRQRNKRCSGVLYPIERTPPEPSDEVVSGASGLLFRGAGCALNFENVVGFFDLRVLFLPDSLIEDVVSVEEIACLLGK